MTCGTERRITTSFHKLKATPHKDRLKALRTPCLQLFRDIAQKLLDIRQYACEISIQFDEKSVGAIRTQSLCGIALKSGKYVGVLSIDNFTKSAKNFLYTLL